MANYLRFNTIFTLLLLTGFNKPIAAQTTFSPYQFEPAIAPYVNIPSSLAQSKDRLANNVNNELVKKVEKLEVEISQIDKNIKFDYEFRNLLANQKSDQIKEVLFKWQEKNDVTLSKIEENLQLLECIEPSFLENENIYQSQLQMADFLRDHLTVLAFTSSKFSQDGLIMPKKLERKWVTFSHILALQSQCFQSLLGNVVNTSLYGSYFYELFKLHESLSDETIQQIVENTKHLNNLKMARQKILLHEQYTHSILLDKIFRLARDLHVNTEDVKLKEFQDVKKLSDALQIEMNHAFNLQETFTILNSYYKDFFQVEFANLAEQSSFEKGDALDRFLKENGIDKVSHEYRMRRLQEGTTFYSKFKRFFSTKEEESLQHDLKNLFGKLGLYFLPKLNNNFSNLLNDQDHVSFHINLLRIKNYKIKNKHLPTWQQINADLVPFAIKSTKMSVDQTTGEFVLLREGVQEPLRVNIGFVIP